MAQGSAICPFCATTGNVKPVTGEIVTPTGTQTVDFDNPDTFQAALDAMRFHAQVGGRPVIEHQCPVAGHQVWLYTDASEAVA